MSTYRRSTRAARLMGRPPPEPTTSASTRLHRPGRIRHVENVDAAVEVDPLGHEHALADHGQPGNHAAALAARRRARPRRRGARPLDRGRTGVEGRPGRGRALARKARHSLRPVGCRGSAGPGGSGSGRRDDMGSADPGRRNGEHVLRRRSNAAARARDGATPGPRAAAGRRGASAGSDASADPTASADPAASARRQDATAGPGTAVTPIPWPGPPDLGATGVAILLDPRRDRGTGPFLPIRPSAVLAPLAKRALFFLTAKEGVNSSSERRQTPTRRRLPRRAGPVPPTARPRRVPGLRIRGPTRCAPPWQRARGHSGH